MHGHAGLRSAALLCPSNDDPTVTCDLDYFLEQQELALDWLRGNMVGRTLLAAHMRGDADASEIVEAIVWNFTQPAFGISAARNGAKMDNDCYLIPVSHLKLEGFSESEIETRCAGEVLVDEIGRPSVTGQLARAMFAERNAARAQREALERQEAAVRAARNREEREARARRQAALAEAQEGATDAFSALVRTRGDQL